MLRALVVVSILGVAVVAEAACPKPPSLGTTGFRHKRSRIVAGLGDPRHRAEDLVLPTTAKTQTITGKITYGKTDKDLEDEDVEILACRNGAWASLGTATTNDDGRFTMTLADVQKLGAGLHELFLSVTADRTGVRFVAFVAAERAKIVVSDVDGTLTSSEKAYWATVAWHKAATPHPSAAKALSVAAAKGYQVIYVTARGGQFTDDTRRWLATNGFPAGPVRLAPTAMVIPGKRTVDYKSKVLAPLVKSFDLVAGVGNRASDISAYTSAGLAADRIFIKLPEFSDELRADLAAKKATGIAHYDELVAKMPHL